MSGGSIDDILARIKRLEAATGPESGHELEPSEPQAPESVDTAAADPGEPDAAHEHFDTASADTNDEAAFDAIDLLTPETYAPDEDDPSSERSDESTDQEPSFEAGSSDVTDAEADAIEPEPGGDREPDLQIDLDSGDTQEHEGEPEYEASDDPIFDGDAQTGSDDDAGSEPEAHAEPGSDSGAMLSIEPDFADEPEPDSEQAPDPVQSFPDESGEAEDEPWVVGANGLQPRSEAHRSGLGAADETASVGGSSADADTPSEAEDPSDHDGMVSINPGGASSTGMSDLFTPDSTALNVTGNTLADVLASTGAISREQIASAERVAEQTPGKDLVAVLRDQGADETVVQTALARHHGLAFERIDVDSLGDAAFDGTMLQRLGLPFCAEHMVLPLRKDGARVVVATTKPDCAFELDEIRRRLNCGTPKLVLTTAADITAALEVAGFGSEERAAQDQVDLSEILEDVDEADVTVEKREEQTVDLEQKAGESPVIRYVNYIIQTAVKEGASDIHIEPAEKKIVVRLRIDGVLYESMNPPANMSAAITSRIKIMANLDISERRVPQDGRIRCTVQGRKLDLRVSTLPAGYGEKVVMRILDTKSINVQLEDLGFDDHTLAIWKHQVKQAHGIVLVTGPTGSGKTTTLYSSLRQLDKNRLNISTAEDPIEYHLEGITQTQTHEKIGMTFSRVLKALLRQDPDVIMLGEIRDHETAHIAVQAALTGHLVLSTLHTNDAPSSITRLVNIGLEPFLVGAAVNAVLAQRLVRRLCAHCKELRDPPPEQVEFLELSGIAGQQIYMPVGCDRCRQTGYSGRVGIYELLAVDDQLRDVIARNPNVSEFRRMCLERGMHSLRQDGMSKVADGLTTVAEVLRVTTDH
ncbi:MAG: ATPase, T2SS/T4P/T4SS family [Planctomycetota bacterium]